MGQGVYSLNSQCSLGPEQRRRSGHCTRSEKTPKPTAAPLWQVTPSSPTPRSGLSQNRHDGQFRHRGHAKIARRVTLSQAPSLRKIRIGDHMRDSPPREEGRYGQSSRNVRRVAIDAQGRSVGDAFDEAVWSRHPDAGVKSRGRCSRSDGGYKARYAEESAE